MSRKEKRYSIPLHDSVLGYKIMGLTLLCFIIALSVYFGSVNLGNFITQKHENIRNYKPLIQTISILLAFAAFFWTFLVFIRRTVSDIKSMSIKLNKITDGELDLRIDLQRKDELGDLARDINKMQESLINRMENEKRAIQNNRELITSLSHDLRTPLTKQMCAIELAKKNHGNDEETLAMLNRIYGHSEQIKTISDELFSYFIAEDGTKNHQLDLESYDGHTLFIQLISEYADFLISSGFEISQEISEFEGCFVTTDVSYLTRIMDNLASNVRKYADKSKAVRISLKKSDRNIFVEFENHVRCDDGKMMDSNNIGIFSARKMAEALGGALSVSLDGDIYTARLILEVGEQNKDEQG